MRLTPDEANAWIERRHLARCAARRPANGAQADHGDRTSHDGLLHGPASSLSSSRRRQRRKNLLDAIVSHGGAQVGPTGQALYMATISSRAGKFLAEDRGFLASQVPHHFDGVFRQVVRFRLEWSVREGNHIFAETVELWIASGTHTGAAALRKNHRSAVARSDVAWLLWRVLPLEQALSKTMLGPGHDARAPEGTRIKVELLNGTRTKGRRYARRSI